MWERLWVEGGLDCLRGALDLLFIHGWQRGRGRGADSRCVIYIGSAYGIGFEKD